MSTRRMLFSVVAAVVCFAQPAMTWALLTRPPEVESLSSRRLSAKLDVSLGSALEGDPYADDSFPIYTRQPLITAIEIDLTRYGVTLEAITRPDWKQPSAPVTLGLVGKKPSELLTAPLPGMPSPLHRLAPLTVDFSGITTGSRTFVALPENPMQFSTSESASRSGASEFALTDLPSGDSTSVEVMFPGALSPDAIAAAPTAAIPEPMTGTLALLGLGAVGLSLRRRTGESQK